MHLRWGALAEGGELRGHIQNQMMSMLVDREQAWISNPKKE